MTTAPPSPYPARVGDVVIIEEPRQASDGSKHVTRVVATVTKVAPGGKLLRVKRLYCPRGEPVFRGNMYRIVAKDVVDVAAIRVAEPPMLASHEAAEEWLKKFATVEDFKTAQADVLAERFSRLYETWTDATGAKKCLNVVS